MKSRRGAGTRGCLLSLLVLVVLVYYTIRNGQVMWRYMKLRDEMYVAARLADEMNDEKLREQLQKAVAEIGVPANPSHFVIQRSPNQIVISISYAETVELPFVHRTFKFRPSVRRQL